MQSLETISLTSFCRKANKTGYRNRAGDAFMRSLLFFERPVPAFGILAIPATVPADLEADKGEKAHKLYAFVDEYSL